MAQYAKNVTEQFMEPEKLPVGWPWRLFVFSIVLSALVVFVYLGIIWGYKPYLEFQRKSFDQKISEIGGAISEEDRQSFISFFSQLVNLQDLLNSHIKGSNIYSLLEENTNQGVYYEGGDLSVAEHFFRLNGVAQSYDNLIQQLVAFEQVPAIERVVLEESQAADKGVRFFIRLIIKPELFKF